MPESERHALGLAHFRSLGRALAEQCVFWYGSEKRAMGMVKLTGREHLDRLRGKPVILFAPHFTGLNLGGPKIGYEFPGSASIYSRQKNPVLDRLLYRGRQRFGATLLLSRQDGMLKIVRALREGRQFYFLPDMDFGPRDAIFVPFFGVPAATLLAPSRMARALGMVVQPVVAHMLPAGQGYRVRFLEPWGHFPSADALADTAQLNRWIEEQIRAEPAQYLWVHKRFKTRPAGEPPLY
jgi:KDO2-lipid IV(A) lauroyltransferase